MELHLKNKYVLVTGAEGGNGFEIAKAFISEGAKVGAHYYGSETGVKKLFKYAKAGQCRIFQADFSKPNEVFRLWKEFFSWGKKADILVNNAAAVGKGEGDRDMIFQVNFKAPLFLSKTAFNAMKKQKSGRIINISSIGVKWAGSSANTSYTASKAALESMTRSLAKNGARYNILVNAVRPGITDSPLHRKLAENDPLFRKSSIPLKRFALPEEIASAVVFLAGHSFITNTIIDVAGGQ